MKNTMTNKMKNAPKNNIANKLLTSALLVTTALTAITAGNAMAQTANSSGAWGVKNPLFDKVAGKLNLTANVGYVYNFASKWDGADIGTGKANGGVGYGARIGWTNTSGFGISGDYLGFTSKWSNGDKQYTNPYHVLTITPSYRFSFGQTKEWGLKVGLGVGMSLADVSWGNAQTAKGANVEVARGKVAGGAFYTRTNVVGVGESTLQPLTCSISASVPRPLEITFQAITIDSKPGFTFASSANKCSASGTSGNPTNVDIANWLKTLGVTSSDGITLDTRRISTGTVIISGSGGIAPEVACLVNGGTWSGEVDSATATSVSCKVAAGTTADSGGKAKDDAGFVLAPEIALEYDNGLLHADLNARYIHGLANVKYNGSLTSSNQLQKSGPLAVFVGAGFGVNF